jgi:hypothetical protein
LPKKKRKPRTTPRIELDFNKVYSSKRDGDYILLEEVKIENDSNRHILIKFLDTGNEQLVHPSEIYHCMIRDRKKHGIDYDKVYSSNNFGDFVIIKDAGSRKQGNHSHKLVKIKFLDTGSVKVVRLADALVGNIRDDYRPNVAGVGCIGNASSYHPAYNVWNSMLQRCYCKTDANYVRYGAKGITVCERWHCFEYFLEDLPYIDGYNNWLNNPELYQLDKDYKQQGIPYNKKIYSLKTCCFIEDYNNVALATKSKNKYIGVTKLINGYNSNITVCGINYNLGSFINKDDAAAAYNNAANYLRNNNLVLNDVPYVDPEILDTRKIRHINMCRIV